MLASLAARDSSAVYVDERICVVHDTLTHLGSLQVSAEHDILAFDDLRLLLSTTALLGNRLT